MDLIEFFMNLNNSFNNNIMNNGELNKNLYSSNASMIPGVKFLVFDL